jgi:hypothetical protein
MEKGSAGPNGCDVAGEDSRNKRRGSLSSTVCAVAGKGADEGKAFPG